MTGDKTYTFTRGCDTVHVTVGGHGLAQAKARLWLAYGGSGLVCLTLGAMVWPLLPVGALLLLALVGRLGLLDQEIRDQAEHAAAQEFERFEVERWQALAAFRGRA